MANQKKNQLVPKKQNEVESKQASLGNLNAELYDVYEEADVILSQETHCIIRSRYKLGELVKKVHEDDSNTYGAKAIERLSKALGRNTTILYDAKKFVETYVEEDVEQLLAVRNSNNQQLCWSHIELLIHVSDDEQRDDLLVAVLENSWTAAELSKKIQSMFNGPRGHSTGRPMAKPKTFVGYLDSIISTAEQLNKRSEQVWLGGDKTMVDASNELDTVDDKALIKIQEARDHLASTVITANEIAKELDEIEKNLVKKREAEEKAAIKAKRAYKKDVVDLKEHKKESKDASNQDDRDQEEPQDREEPAEPEESEEREEKPRKSVRDKEGGSKKVAQNQEVRVTRIQQRKVPSR